MTVTKPRRQVAMQTASFYSEEAALPPSKAASQSASLAMKNKEKITSNKGSRFSILTDQPRDLNEELIQENCPNNYNSRSLGIRGKEKGVHQKARAQGSEARSVEKTIKDTSKISIFASNDELMTNLSPLNEARSAGLNSGNLKAIQKKVGAGRALQDITNLVRQSSNS